MLQVGDIVTIRKDLSERDVFNEVYVNRDMLQFRGKTYTIAGVSQYMAEPSYILDLGLNIHDWRWREGMFEEPLIEPNELLALLEEA